MLAQFAKAQANGAVVKSLHGGNIWSYSVILWNRASSNMLAAQAPTDDAPESLLAEVPQVPPSALASVRDWQ